MEGVICVKRIVCFVLIVSMLASFFMLSAGAEDVQTDADQPVFLLMGDSIPDAFGIENRDEACYGRIVADTDHFRYRNLGRTAMDSAELLDFIDRYAVWDDELDDWHGVKAYIAEADILCLSIGGNDYFDQDNTKELLVGALFGVNKKALDAIADQYYENLCAILDRIESINPDAVVLVQTLYCVWYGLAAVANRACSKRINTKIEQYDREHPGRIHICDIAPAMHGKPRNLADDCVHPNARGNVAIAEIVLQTLYDLGLGTETTPVVNVPGEDWNYFAEVSEKRSTALFLTALVMLVTGNGVNIFRLLKQAK